MKDYGWIKLHRKILDHPIFTDPHALTLWVQLLLRANHKDNKFMIGNKFVSVKRGELLTGRNKLSKYTGLNRSKIDRLLKLFEIEQQVSIKATTKYRIISITNYEYWQGTEQQKSHNRATTEHKQECKELNINIPELNAVIGYFLTIGLSKEDAAHFRDHYLATGWKKNNQPITDWQAQARIWKIGNIQKKSSNLKSANVLSGISDNDLWNYAKNNGLPDPENGENNYQYRKRLESKV